MLEAEEEQAEDEVNNRDPSIMEHMKHENMRPKGGSAVIGGVEVRREDFKDADQKKMKRYMAPSKMHEVVPRVRMRGSERESITLCI